jgi:hypothetical protein
MNKVRQRSSKVKVEHDILARESDEIELSVHSYREGQEQSLSFIPRFIFTLRQENNIWRLTDVVASARVPWADPDYLRGLRRQQQEANASAAQMRITTIATAQAGDADLHPDRGYTCSLAALFAPEPIETPADDNEQPVIFYDPAQANTEWSGYRFALTGCEGSRSSKYEITAIPIDSDADTKTFCADEAGTVKSVTGGKPSDCFNSGDVLSSPK